MPYFNRRRAKQPIKTDKHEVTWSNLAQDAGTATIDVNLFTGVASADKNLTNECEIGSHVKSIYFEFNIAAETTTNPKVVHWAIHHAPDGTIATAGSNPSNYYQIGRHHIIKRGMEMLPRDVATVYKRIFVVLIPRKMRRVGSNDKLFLSYRCSSTESINFCGIAIYKEYY